LSLSSSEPEDPRSPSRSTDGDTTEDESSQEENDYSGLQGRGNQVDNIEEDAPQDWNMKPNLGKELEIPQQADLSGKCNIIAFQCIAE
jgi:hypothetical protein